MYEYNTAFILREVLDWIAQKAKKLLPKNK